LGLAPIMKTIFTLCIFVLFGAINLHAQVPNGSFENWTGYHIDNWPSTNALIFFGNPQTLYKSSDAHTGSFACEVNTLKIKVKPNGFFVPDYSGSLFVGNQTQTESVPGFPFSEKPTQFRFWYKTNGRNNDSANVLVALSKWNTTTKQRDTLSYGYAYLLDSVGIYTEKIMYLDIKDSTRTPDTAVIYISAATIYATKEGSRLLIDDLKFAGGTLSVNSLEDPSQLALYPNPSAKGVISLQLSNRKEIEAIRVLNLQGMEIRKLYHPHPENIDLQLPSGIYFIEVSANERQMVKKLIVQ
jgi:hypothetical protein